MTVRIDANAHENLGTRRLPLIETAHPGSLLKPRAGDLSAAWRSGGILHTIHTVAHSTIESKSDDDAMGNFQLAGFSSLRPYRAVLFYQTRKDWAWCNTLLNSE